MRRRNFLRLGSGETIGGALAGCGVDAATIATMPAPQAQAERQAGAVRRWNELALQAIRDTQAAAPASAHALARLHTCMYNAWAAYDDQARQTMHGRAVRLPRAERSAASKASAMSHAAHGVLCELFPSHRAGFDACMAGLGLDPSRLAAQFTPAGIGRAQATAMLDACRRERAGSAGATAADLPFALVFPDPLRPGHPAASGGAASGAAAPADGLDAGRLDTRRLDHWCRLAQQLSERAGYDDDRDVLLYFVLANALADAASAAANGHDGGDGRAASGQGAQDAAAAAVLRSFSGDRLGAGAAGRTGPGRGGAAETAGLELGKKIGALVFEKARRYWQGKLWDEGISRPPA